MGFPDRIERTVELAHPPAKVWAALTTAEGLGAWFGNEAAIDLRPGGAGWMSWTDGLTVEHAGGTGGGAEGVRVHLAAHELPDDDPRRTYVEFTLEPAGTGTRLTVVETGFAQLPAEDYARCTTATPRGGRSELGELAGYLDAA